MTRRVTADELDAGQYTLDAIGKYEAIYGRGYVSPGGRETALECITALELGRDECVLDVGCGLGGAAILMASERGVRVHAIDLSANMVALARERVREADLEDRIRVEQTDCLDIEGEACYDALYSRDVFLHVHDKAGLFAAMHRLAAPGARLVITDYCCAPRPWSDAFARYVVERGYDLHTVDAYAAMIAAAGFELVRAEDRTARFVEIHREELARLPRARLPDASARELEAGWRAKIERASAGEHRWGYFLARRAE